MAAGFVEKVSEKVSFTAKVPMLMKATADNETPTPGYLYQEINKITFESVSNCQLLVDFLNDRLKKSSPHIKYKALKIMTYLSANGQSEFRSSLRHQSEPVRLAASFTGSVSALHGDALNQKVRKAAIELIELLFNVENPESAQQSFIMAGPTGKKMEGFGNAPLQTNRNTTIFDTVKGLSSHITTLSGFLQPKQGLVSSVYNKQASSTSLDPESRSVVKFVNYDTWTKGNADILRNSIDSDFSACEENKKEDIGKLESQLVDRITEGGGVRTVPSRQSLDEFAQKCRSLDIDRVLYILNSKLDEPALDIQMKSLYAIEHLLRTNLPDIAIKVLLNCASLQHLIETETGKLQSKANKILCTAKLQSSGHQNHITVEGNLLNESPKIKQKGNLIDNIFDNGLSLKTTNQPKQEHLSENNMDIFHGLQIRQETKPSSENQAKLNANFDLLNIYEESKPPSNRVDYCSMNAEVFDPLDMRFDKKATNNSDDCMVPCQVDQKRLESNTDNSNSNLYLAEKSVNDPFNLLNENVKAKQNNDFIDLVNFEQNQATSSIPCHNGHINGKTSSASQTCLSSHSGFALQSSFTNQSNIPSQSSSTSQSNIPSQSSLASQSSLTSQSCFAIKSSLTSQTGFDAGNPVLQSLLMSKTSQKSTKPLNLSESSSQKTDFDFLNKSKRETAFSFVQDEMKASKR